MSEYFINYNEQTDEFEVVESATEVVIASFLYGSHAATYLHHLTLKDY